MTVFKSVYDNYQPLASDELFYNNKDMQHTYMDLIITKGKRKKRAWTIGAIVTLIVVAVIIATLILLKDESHTTSLGLNKNVPAITLEDYLDGRLNPASFNASWISGTELLYRNREGSILKYNVVSGLKTILLPAGFPLLATAFDYQLSPDQKFLLIAHDYQKLYRHSYVALYSVVNLETKGVSKVMANSDIVLQYTIWGPVGNSLFYVSRYNIFYRPSAEYEQYVALTTDGVQGHIYNGVPDWVYEEEVLSSNKAIWISPDGTKLAYAKFNDSNVPVMTVPVYGLPGSLDFQYTRSIQIRYPKPGARNPDISLNIINLKDLSQRFELQPPDTLLQSEPILGMVAWANSKILTAAWTNRIQNEGDIMAYNVEENSATSVTVKHFKQENGWLDLFTTPVFSKSGDKMLFLLSQLQENEAGGYKHIALLETKGNTSIKAITKGMFTVMEILAWDEEKDLIFYQATTKNDSAQQHVYTISTSNTSAIHCYSCGEQTTIQKTECLHNSATVSKDNTHFVLQCTGPNVPEISIYNSSGSRLLTWESNKDLIDFVHEKQTPIIKRLSFPVADGFTAQVMLHLPPNIDTSGNTKYPMLINVYGGPDSFQIVEVFKMGWGAYLATNKSIIYGAIDARGSGLKGDKILFTLYKQLGTVEILDQINVTKQIQETLPYVDASRTAIWGWSYGGYASAMSLALDRENIFKCGISVAPVTDWLLYDSIYTEKFMGIPANNSKGYEKAQLLNKYEGLRNKKYYLIHGTLDDNVHYQQSMLWSKVLEEKDILFRQQSYADEDHGLASVRPHLYHSLENFLDECFVVDKL